MIGRFFFWWGNQLRAIVPFSAAGDAGRWLEISVDAQRVRAAMSDRREQVLMDVPRSQGNELQAELARIAQGMDPARARCRVRLPAQEVLSRDIELPMAAEENLREVLSFEMARKTPFRADDVYFDAAITARDSARRMLALRLNVVPRRVLDVVMTALSPWSPEPVAATTASRAGDGGDQAVFAFQSASFVRRSFGRANLALAALVVALVVVCAWLPIKTQQDRQAELREQLLDARDAASRAMALRDELDGVQRANRFLAQALAERAPMVVVLDSLSKALPDNTFLTRFQVTDGEVNLHGSSQTASELIAILEQLPLLEGVRFASPVTRDSASGGERFHVVARLVATTPAPGTKADRI